MSTVAQRSFAAGEIAPALWARVDTVRYATGLKTCRNSLIMRHGGSASRPGTQFVAEVKSSIFPVRLIPFIFNESQTYVLEFGGAYMRVHRNGTQLTLPTVAISGITKANPAVITTSAPHGITSGFEIQVAGVQGMTEVNGRNFRVLPLTSTTLSLYDLGGTYIDSTGFGTYTSGGTIAPVYEIATPYAAADVAGLKFVESADVITLVHSGYPPYELRRYGDTNWTLSAISFGPLIAAPYGLGVSNYSGGGWPIKSFYAVTAVAQDTFEESYVSGVVGTDWPIDENAPVENTLSWTGISGAVEYNVYSQKNGVFGLIGIAGSTTFKDLLVGSSAGADSGLIPDLTKSPPSARNLFSSSGNYPSAVAYYQQRLMFGGSDNAPLTVWASRTGTFKNFTIRSPLQDDDSLTFTMAGRQVNAVRHIVDIGRLVILTSAGEWVVDGDSSGILKPSAIHPKQYGNNGSATIAPLVVGGNLLFVQARGSIIRDLGYEFQSDSYKGNDLTIYSAHLLDGYTIADWAYQQVPHSIVWAVRSDGVLLGMTYVREQQLIGWHRHDFDGAVENVCAVPEGSEDVIYLVIRRTVNGRTVRYIERLQSRLVSNIADYCGVDCGLTYDGRNTNLSRTMTLSGGTTWAYDELLTLTSSASLFAASDVGNAIFITAPDGSQLRFSISAYTSATVVQGFAQRTVPVSLRGVAVSTWAKAVSRVSGAWHLEGKPVSVVGDGFVIANPNNAATTQLTVSGGTVALDRPYSVIHVGLPYLCDIETLDMDTAQGETLADKKKQVSELTVFVDKSRGLWAGAEPPSNDTLDPLEGLTELKVRELEAMDQPVALATGRVKIRIQPQWDSNGRIFIRQVDPLPLSVLAVAADGMIPVGARG